MSPPTHISLPPPPSFPELARSSDPASPALSFYTPPSSPLNSPNIYYTPPTSPPMQPIHTDDPFPIVMDVALDLALDDEGLTTLEKIYLYSRSRAAFHRVFIAHALPAYLTHVTPQEAVEYVLPLLSGLAMDDDESVKEALAPELVPIIWWFFSHCQIIPDDLRPEDAYASSSSTVTISVQAFTPILGTLLLSSNPLVGGAARFAVVDLLSRINKADKKEIGSFYHHTPDTPAHPWETTQSDHGNDDDFEDETPPVIGLFGAQERAMFMQEILQQVVIGMGRLDVGVEGDVDPKDEQPSTRGRDTDRINPYFPSISANRSPSSSSTFHSWSSSAPSRSTESTSLHSQNMGPINDFSPGTEFPPSLPSTSPSHPPVALGSTTNLIGFGNRDDDIYDDGEYIEDEQAAVGRLSSMSLMAAVTASVTLQDDIQHTFVKEVERVAHDPIYWVRREASFALGALAKIVPEEIINISLLPIFLSLRWDRVWHVRHSTLFALPAILSRLSPPERRTLAVETILALFVDESPTVRFGVLEALGEVLHTFLGDPDGPPNELIHLFLGRKEDRRVRDGQQELGYKKEKQTPSESFFTDPKRPLICAFNFPAVALTLGGKRWCEIREVYLEIASNPASGVRRTLAASLGEIAKIIGSEHAQTDLMDVWWRSIKSDDEEVRMKAVECLYDLVGVVGKDVGKTLIQGLLTVWNQGILRGWRERELVGKHLFGWVNLLGLESASLAREFLAKGLEDNAAAVRDTAISTISQLYAFFSSRKDVIDAFRGDLQKLATSPTYRKRMTFIACQQTLALSVGKDNESLVTLNSDFFRPVTDLASDDIEGVRIGVARFAGLIYGNLLGRSQSIPSTLLNLIHRLSQDPSREVQSYVHVVNPSPVSVSNKDASLANSRQWRKSRLRISTFSRPPPLESQTAGHSPPVSPLKPSSHRTISEYQPTALCYNGSTAQIPNIGVSSSPLLMPKEEIRI
ncbi:ARM repeat-containing protein [Phlegmacium glaucopus]|nr:ARM repeat-containing protein [Phlegmacium glaucopus]